jgi:hypothetical protein
MSAISRISWRGLQELGMVKLAYIIDAPVDSVYQTKTILAFMYVSPIPGSNYVDMSEGPSLT